MSKLYLDRLKKRYKTLLTQKQYKKVMSNIISNAHENVQKAVGRIKQDEFMRQRVKIKKSTTQQVAVPNLEDVLPKRSVYVRKGVEQSQIISDTLRDRLTKDLRGAVKEYLQTGKDSMQYKKGERRGQIKPELVNRFRKQITKTFEGYTKPDATGVPKNIKNIAETEVRSAIDDIKHTYNERLQAENPGKIQIMKKWISHPSFSETPRKNHRVLNGTVIPLDSRFVVPLMEWKKGTGMIQVGFSSMLHPHDPDSPAGQVIGCHCECVYITRFI